MKEYIVHEPPGMEEVIVQKYTTFYGEPIKELIRCKDCKHWIEPPIYVSGEYGLCGIRHDALIAKKPNGYCDEAEQRKEE